MTIEEIYEWDRGREAEMVFGTRDTRHPLVSELLEYVAGETITIDVLRDGEMFQTTLTLGERA